jgi:hypothetical protein
MTTDLPSLAEVLAPCLSSSSCTQEAEDALLAALAELRRVPQPCSDAVAVARVARWAVTRRLRRTATVLLQSMLLATRIPVTQGVALLLEGLQLCVQTLHARAIANGTQADCPGAVRLRPSREQHCLLRGPAAPVAPTCTCVSFARLGLASCDDDERTLARLPRAPHGDDHRRRDQGRCRGRTAGPRSSEHARGAARLLRRGRAELLHLAPRRRVAPAEPSPG